MHIKDHSAAMKFFRTYDSAASKGKWKDFVDEMEFESMIQKPRTMAQEPRMGLDDGGRIGLKQGNITTHPVTPLSKDEAKIFKMVQEKKLPHQKGVSGSEKLAQTYNKPWEKLHPDQRRNFKQQVYSLYKDRLAKTKGMVSRAQLSEILTEKFGRPISLGQIHGYGGTRAGIRKKTEFSKKLDELLDVKRITPKNPMYKIPTDADIKKLESLLDITPSNSLKNSTVDSVVKLNKKYGDVYKSGKLPNLETVLKHFPEMTASQASNATVKLSQIYRGNKFKLFSNLDPKLRKAAESIEVDKKTGNTLFKLMGGSPFNEYHRSMYRVSLGIIDEKLGNRKGTFENLKVKARHVLKENKIPIYDPKVKNSFGFNINEIAGVSGSAKSKAAEFSQFIDIMEGNLNRKTLANFQSMLSRARVSIEKDPSKLSSESKRINKLARDLEDAHGIKLPRLRDPDATKYFSPTRLKQLEGQGLDVVKAAERAGYTIEMPKGAVTVKEFTEQGPKAKKMLGDFKNTFSKTFQDLSPQSVLQMGRTHGCLKKNEGGSIMRCLQTKFNEAPEKFLQRSAPLAKGNPNLVKWFKTGRNIARGTGVFALWEAALAPVLMSWMATEGESWDRMKHDLAYGPILEALGVSPKFVPGISEKEEWMEAAGGDEKAYTMKRMGEIEEQELPYLYQQLEQVQKQSASTRAKMPNYISPKERYILDDIKEKEQKLQGYYNIPEFYEGPAGRYLDEPAVMGAYNLADATTAKIEADKAARKKDYKIEAISEFFKTLPRMASGGLTRTVAPDSEGIMSLKKKR